MALFLSDDWDKLAILDTTGEVQNRWETKGQLEVKRQSCRFHR